MAIFQQSEPHDDTTPRRQLTADDIAFLQALQSTLNTQDTFCTRKPVFWMISENKPYLCDPSEADFFCVHCYDTNEDFETVEALAEHTHTLLDEACTSYIASADNLPEAFERFSARRSSGYALLAYSNRQELNRNAIFLTHEACQEYLRRFSYRHTPDAHAYCMSATGVDQIEKLLDILSSVNWTACAQSE